LAEIALLVPSRHRQRFATLLVTPADVLSSLADTLEGTKLTSLSSTALAEVVASRTGMAHRDVLQTIGLLTNLYYLPEFIPVPRDQLASRIAAAIDADEKLHAAPEQLTIVRDFLERTLALENPIGLLSKAIHLVGGHERTYGGARIFSDLRAIFDATPGRPRAFIVDHVLQIHYHTGSGGEEIYIALQRKDLSALAKVIKRAEDKELELRKLAESLDIQFLEGGDE